MKKAFIPVLTIIAMGAVAFAFAPQDACCKDKEKSAVAQEGKADACAAGAKVNGKDACCKSTAEKPIAKGEKGCCNAKGEPAKFKVYVVSKYQYFGCEGSATKGRLEAVKAGLVPVGNVQAVVGKVLMN